MDVFNHYDRVIHQYADGEDQGKERNPVKGVADQIKNQHGQGQCYRNGNCCHGSGAPSHEQRNQDGDRDGGQKHVEEQFVVLLPCCLAIIAGNSDLQVGRYQLSLE